MGCVDDSPGNRGRFGRVDENLWICVDALRNGFDCILLELEPFIAARLASSGTDWPDCTAFWTFLGLQHDMVDRFTELELRFGNCLLYGHRRCSGCVDLEKI